MAGAAPTVPTPAPAADPSTSVGDHVSSSGTVGRDPRLRRPVPRPLPHRPFRLRRGPLAQNAESSDRLRPPAVALQLWRVGGAPRPGLVRGRPLPTAPVYSDYRVATTIDADPDNDSLDNALGAVEK